MSISPQHDLLNGLLDYVKHRFDEVDIGKLTLPQDLISPDSLAGLPGVTLNPKDGTGLWLTVQRLHPGTPPLLATGDAHAFICTSNQPETAPTLNLAGLADADAAARTMAESDTDFAARHLSRLRQAEAAFAAYVQVWSKWAAVERPRRLAIELYDRLFTWHFALTAASNTPQEFIAGIGLLGWKLPSTGHDYLYPLISQPLEITMHEGMLRIGPRETPARAEFDALLAQAAIGNAGELHTMLKEGLADGRDLNPFDSASFSDLLTALADQLDAHTVLNKSEITPPAGPDPHISFGWRWFMRPRSANVVLTDLFALQQAVLRGDALPEQAMSMVTAPASVAKPSLPITFRGRCGIDGHDSRVEELYFPLPYNREQISIIEQLSQNAGVVVQGPPGTGKTHTIANIICHYLALGKRVLVTAEKANALKTVQEKIPADLRALVVSRVGTEQDGRTQLQSSIDTILQRLTQMREADVKQEIAEAEHEISMRHDEMALIERELKDIADRHLSDIVVDGVTMRPAAMAELVLHGVERFAWFNDQLNMDACHATPLTIAEGAALTAARRAVGSYIAYHDTPIPPSAGLASMEQIAHLHQVFDAMRQLDVGERSGTVWPLQKTIGADLTPLRSLQETVDALLPELAAFEVLREGSPWLADLRSKLNVPSLATEQAALAKLLPDLVELSQKRASFMGRPVAIPEGLAAMAKAESVLRQAAVSGKAFSWLSLASRELKQAIAQITVSGLAPQHADDWQWVVHFFDTAKVVTSVMARFNQFAGALSLPRLELNGRDTGAMLAVIDTVQVSIEQTRRVAMSIDRAMGPALAAVFAQAPMLCPCVSTAELLLVRAQLSAQLAKADLTAARAFAQSLQQQLANCRGNVSEQLSKLIADIGSGQNLEELLSSYRALCEQVRVIEALAPSLALIGAAADRFEQAGAPLLAKRLRGLPSAGDSADPALPQDWSQAWTWARLKSHLELVDGHSTLRTLAARRHECEQRLASRYALVSAQRSWLALKRGASDAVIAALNRYQTAVYKVGKGTGLGANRQRLIARDAMAEAAQAIPCMVMTQFQVSETLPAQLGMFDLIIVDEASQSDVTALPVLLRGKKVLVVGDDKQVSPSNIGLANARINQLQAKYLAGQPRQASFAADLSLYDMASQVYRSQVMLLEHFRCHPAIIAYSNRTFYSEKILPLRTSKQSERLDPPLVSIYVPEGVRSKQGVHNLNKAEAQAIVAELAVLLADERYAGRSIGVISLLGAAQASYIQTMAMSELDVVQLQQRNFVCGEPASFQGAERDIIFLSMVADPVQHHALSRNDHSQRFNVAASRARERMYLIHSVQPQHLSPTDLRLGLLAHFSHPSAAERPNLDALQAACDSDFERDVLRELYERGYHVTPQVRAGAFRIDMVVDGDTDARLAIECDGDRYHGPEQWPADMARQRALERAGWTFWRCFASTWTISRADTLADLLARLEQMGILPGVSQHGSYSLCDQRIWHRPADTNANPVTDGGSPPPAKLKPTKVAARAPVSAPPVASVTPVSVPPGPVGPATVPRQSPRESAVVRHAALVRGITDEQIVILAIPQYDKGPWWVRAFRAREAVQAFLETDQSDVTWPTSEVLRTAMIDDSESLLGELVDRNATVLHEEVHTEQDRATDEMLLQVKKMGWTEV